MTTYTRNEIFQHMSPSTLAGWIGDMDNAPDELSLSDMALMELAMTELFAIVGMEAVTILAKVGIDETHPLLSATIAAYNED